MPYQRAHILIIIACLGYQTARGQESASVFNFLNLPTSAHTTALGGRNISLMDEDPSMAFQNPALIYNSRSHSINLNFMTYMKGSKTGSVAYSQQAGERASWGIGTQFVGYGQMNETLATGEIIDQAKALDMCITGMYSYALSEYWVGGAAGKIIYSNYAGYTSCAMAVDLGLNYYNADQSFSFSAVAANLGGQVKAFGDVHEKLPFNLQFGLTKGIAHAPISLSLTLVDMNRWNKDYYYSPEGRIGTGKLIMNHLNVGVDIHPTKQVYVAAGYNFRRANEMKAAGSSHASGLTFGAGVQVKHFKLGLAYAKYHVSSPTLAMSVTYSIK